MRKLYKKKPSDEYDLKPDTFHYTNCLISCNLYYVK